MTARALASAGHTVHAGIRDTAGRNAGAVADAAVARVVAGSGGLDVVIHNAGHIVLGPTEAFTPEQLASVYDTNVVSTQRLNRAALPHPRAQGHGLVVWVGWTSTRGGTPPYLAPYFAAQAGMDALAVSYAAELAPPDADPTEVARAIGRVVDTPAGQRPFRVHVDPADDGAEVVNAVASASAPSSTGGSGSTISCTRSR